MDAPGSETTLGALRDRNAHRDMDVLMVADSGSSSSWPSGDRRGDGAGGRHGSGADGAGRDGAQGAIPDAGNAARGSAESHGDSTRAGAVSRRGSLPTINADDFDALADLFLGEVSSGPAKGSPSQTTMPTGSANAAAPADPVERSVGESPRLSAATGPGGDRGRLELLLVGHLPVMTSAWVGQFVRQESQPTERSVASALAFIRMHDERLRIERYASAVRTRGDIADDASGAAIMYEPGDEPIALCLAEPRVLVWAQGAIDVLAAQPGLFARVHVLTAGDETGVVNAYRTLKSLVDAWRRGGHPVATQPRFALSVLGVPMDRARASHARLSEACRSFLGLELEFHASIERIGSAAVLPMPPRVVFDEETGWTVGEVISAVARPVAMPDPEPDVSRGEPDAAVIDGDEGIEVLSDLRLAEPALDDTSEFQAINPGLPGAPDPATAAGAETTFAAQISGAMAHGASAAGASPASAGASAAAAPVADESERPTGAELDLAHFVPGLAGIAARCPYAEEVQLAVDALGRLHLLARADDDDASAIEWLTVASAWATEHLKLLGMTLPTAQRLDESLRPTLHLFSDRASRVRRLLDTDMRVHVLADTSRAAQAGLVAVALN
jgi:hypothetical protein